MSLFGDIGNIFHSIGHFFNNGDHNNNQPQYQPPNVNSILTGRVVTPNGSNNNQNNNNQNNSPNNNQNQQQQQQQLPTPSVNLYQGPLKKVNPNPNNPNLPFMQRVQQINAQANSPETSTADRAINTVADSVARSVVGVPQGISQLYDLVTPGHGTNRLTKMLNNGAEQVDQEQAKNGLQGRVGSDVYHGLQVAENVIPGAAEAIAKAPALIDGGVNLVKNAPTLIKTAVPDILANAPAKIASVAGQAGDAISSAGQTIDHLFQLPDEAGALNKINTATDTKIAAGIQQPDEVVPGVKSVNPTQATDALAHVQQQEAEAAANAAPQPVPGETVQPANANPQAPAPAPPHPDVMNENEAATLAQLNKDAKTRVLSTDEKNTRSALQAKADHIDQSNNPETPQNAAQTPNVEPQQPVNGPTAPNAPNIRAQAQKDLEGIGQQVDKNINDTVPKNASPEVGAAKVHEVLSNEQLNGAADRYVQSMSPEELKNALQNGMPVNGAGDIAKAYAAVKRLGKMAATGDEEAKSIIPKILDSVEQHVSGAGRSMNYTGSMLDSLPKEAQLEYIVKDINKTRAAAGLDPLSDAEESNARNTLTKYLTEIEDKQDAAAGAKGKIDEIKARAEKGEANLDEIKQIAEYQKSAEQNTRDANQLKTQVGKEYLQYAPQKGNFAKTSGDYARSSMLTKVTGRLSDVATTGLNVIHHLNQSSVEAGMGKALNKTGMFGGAPGKYSDTMPNIKAMVQGTGKGGRDLASNYKGNVETPDLYSAIRQKGMGGKAQLGAANSGNRLSQFVRKAGHAMAETATNLSEGVGANKIHAMAMQQGKQMGLEGDQLKVWAAGAAANPTPEMARAGKQVVDEVNNMNDNKLTELMDNLSKAFTKSKFGNSKPGKLAEFGGEQVRNIVAPFTRWAAGAAWNGATDKNVLANFVKIAGQLSIKDGKLAVADPQELVHQIAGLAVNGGEAMTLGYALASHGVLTTTNAEGYNDEGMYLHVGGHYIPVGFLGFFAPGIVMGAATHQAVTDKTPGKSVLSKIVEAAGTTFGALTRSDLTNTMIGGNNEFIKQVQEALQNKNSASGTDAAATAAADAAGSYIPGIAGDANTAINTFNIANLNPNHETALTKVTKGETGVLTKDGAPSTAKDIPRSDVNQLLNKVPVLGQAVLPRKPGVAAPDFGSAIARGDNESASQAADNKAIAALPAKDQQGVRNALLKTDGAARIAAQKAADAQPGGLTKIKAQQVADKLNFNSSQGPLETAIANAKQSDAVGAFKGSNKQMQTIGDKTYANINGQTKTFDTPQQAQQAIDAEKFKASGKQSDTINGTKFQRGSDGKITHMDQKDFDYKNATNDIKNAKASGDMNGIFKGQRKLLDNIQWQLNHADLTDENKNSLIDTAANTQAEYNRYKLWGDTTKPKGAPDYRMEFGGGNDKSSAYIKTIKEMGVKYGLDTNALLAVASAEGLGGGVGDGGHAFGPFQMNDAGGVLTGKFGSSQEAQKYAESPQGIEDAIKQIAAVAKDKIGPDAINAIVTQFERPADPTGEIARARAAYEGTSKVILPATPDGLVTGSSSDSSLVSDGTAAQNAANLVKQNVVGSLLQPGRENFINDLATRPNPLSIPQIKLTSPQSLIKAHKITVGMPKA